MHKTKSITQSGDNLSSNMAQDTKVNGGGGSSRDRNKVIEKSPYVSNLKKRTNYLNRDTTNVLT